MYGKYGDLLNLDRELTKSSWYLGKFVLESVTTHKGPASRQGGSADSKLLTGRGVKFRVQVGDLTEYRGTSLIRNTPAPRINLGP